MLRLTLLRFIPAFNTFQATTVLRSISTALPMINHTYEKSLKDEYSVTMDLLHDIVKNKEMSDETVERVNEFYKSLQQQPLEKNAVLVYNNAINDARSILAHMAFNYEFDDNIKLRLQSELEKHKEYRLNSVDHIRDEFSQEIVDLEDEICALEDKVSRIDDLLINSDLDISADDMTEEDHILLDEEEFNEQFEIDK